MPRSTKVVRSGDPQERQAPPPARSRAAGTAFAVTLIAGRPKVGKSTLVFALLARLVAGTPFAGVETVPAGVLVLTEERRDTLAEKARVFGLIRFRQPPSPRSAQSNRPVHVLMRHDVGVTNWPEVVRQAMAYCHQQDLGVLVVDTWDRWTSLRGDSENTSGATNEALQPLLYAAASGLAVVIVTHNLQQAYRVADYVGFMYLGDLVEYGGAKNLFGKPREDRTKEYISGGFG